ncbi:MAG: alpha/beta fold hydrolase [Pseudomonadota bacterium]
MRAILLGWLTVSLCACLGGGLSPQADPAAAFVEAEAGAPFPVAAPKSFGSRSGYLVVRERHGDPASRRIRLPVVVINAKNPSGRPPVLFLAGGPGSSGLSAAAYPGAYPWTTDRDFVVLGQRGTQDAEPSLLCEDYLEALGSEGAGTSDLVDAAAACRERYERSGVDLSAYHSAASASDIESLRIALGVDQWSLYGLSYGTRLALTYARDYPHGVASMVLDSPLPHTAVYDDESPGNYRDVLRRIGDACAASAPCNEAYPDVFARFDDALAGLSSKPWEIRFASGETRAVEPSELAALPGAWSPSAVARAPRVMDAVARRDASVVAPLLKRASSPSEFAWGMRLSVWCSEAAPKSRPGSARAEAGAFAGLDGAVVPPEVCSAWNVRERPRRERRAARSDAPTLVIAGEYDANTPPQWAFLAAEPLSNGAVAIIPFGGHTETTNWGGDGCAMRIAAQFFEDERAFLARDGEAAPCLAERSPPDFVLPRR